MNDNALVSLRDWQLRKLTPRFPMEMLRSNGSRNTPTLTALQGKNIPTEIGHATPRYPFRWFPRADASSVGTSDQDIDRGDVVDERDVQAANIGGTQVSKTKSRSEKFESKGRAPMKIERLPQNLVSSCVYGMFTSEEFPLFFPASLPISRPAKIPIGSV